MKRNTLDAQLRKLSGLEEYTRVQEETRERLEKDYYAVYQFKGEYYCIEHAAKKLSNGSYLELERMIMRGSVATIHEETVSYEQYAGEIIPKKGVTCKYRMCKSELYPAY